MFVSDFPRIAELLSIVCFGADEPEPEGSVKLARFTINDIEFMARDSHLDHKFSFTPSMSLYVECESESEIQNAFGTLVKGGVELMPLDNYGFSEKFGWLNDKYGVSWQFNLAEG